MPITALPRPPPATAREVLARYPHVCAHIICESLGYATPSMAGSILLAVIKNEKHYCEWIACCYGCDPVMPVRNAIRHRHSHRGYMAEYEHALALVRAAIATGEEPVFASWF